MGEKIELIEPKEWEFKVSYLKKLKEEYQLYNKKRRNIENKNKLKCKRKQLNN